MPKSVKVNFEYKYFWEGYFFAAFAFTNSKLNEKPPCRAA
jgi:hypothetical protein